MALALLDARRIQCGPALSTWQAEDLWRENVPPLRRSETFQSATEPSRTALRERRNEHGSRPSMLRRPAEGVALGSLGIRVAGQFEERREVGDASLCRLPDDSRMSASDTLDGTGRDEPGKMGEGAIVLALRPGRETAAGQFSALEVIPQTLATDANARTRLIGACAPCQVIRLLALHDRLLYLLLSGYGGGGGIFTGCLASSCLMTSIAFSS